VKPIMIIPATAALLTGLSATAQGFNDSAGAVKTSAPVLYTDVAPELDEMTIGELNALQLQRLQVASTTTVETGDTMVQVETSAEAGMETVPSDTMESETAASVGACTEMNAQDDVSDNETMAAPDTPDMTADQDDPVVEDEMQPVSEEQ
jgi:hypothetical protein